jgi:hypothetical protein
MSNSTLTIPLPKSWPAKVRSAMLQVVSLAEYTAVYTDCPRARVRFRVERDRYQEDNALLREELRIKDARIHSRFSSSHGSFLSPTSSSICFMNVRVAFGPLLEPDEAEVSEERNGEDGDKS